MNEEEIIIINDEPFYRILNGTSYDYAPMPKAFKPYFERLEQENEDLQQEITKLKGVIETYEIIIKSTNVLNWHELKKWLEEIIKQYREKEWFSTAKYLEDVLNKMQELENKQCHTTLE